MLGLGKAKTLQLVHSGRLPAKQLDGRIRVRLTERSRPPNSAASVSGCASMNC
jgi:hypothetical protein